MESKIQHKSTSMKWKQTHRCREQTCCQGVGVAEGRIGSLGLTEIEYYT